MSDWQERIAVAVDVAARHAHDVDREALFPSATFKTLKQLRLLAPPEECANTRELGSMEILANACSQLSGACASTGLVFAMHHAQLQCLLRHSKTSPWHQDLLADIIANQLLLASSTTDGSYHGNHRWSEASFVQQVDSLQLRKAGALISYCDEADVLLVSARASEEAAATEQRLIAVRAEQVQRTLTQAWDAMGMRGTRSATYDISISARAEQVFPDSFAQIFGGTMLLASHILWSSVWYGIASDSASRAKALVRKSPKSIADRNLAEPLVQISCELATIKMWIDKGISRYQEDQISEQLGDLFPTLMKVQCSELAVRVVSHALEVCGLPGYVNGGLYSLSRHLRDINSAPLMISNGRIIASNALASVLPGPHAGNCR